MRSGRRKASVSFSYFLSQTCVDLSNQMFIGLSKILSNIKGAYLFDNKKEFIIYFKSLDNI
ncbi:hypothetical protein HMPREF0083_03280 [Aneurinibacillus aneurinilyticus ATCC 12856]|uniref:Uncharacterized protein n=1 Tax=Aneurinibacillus aneurinilyticus ATCC 12856 TaxID=649747 RepID=U1WJ76_ANEAE|nr:hypothetical protein HMPREF0083_03280 [Aneurinibacillus aneurinilyticus ATCC 12856]